ncbi:type I phosphomannose isomerase catalytic subunit [Lutibacter sp.]
MLNYPLKFTPIVKEKIWGGTKLVTQLNKKLNSATVGESWEISDIEKDVSIVSNGNLKNTSLKKLLETYKSDLIGENNYANFKNNFPLLIKFIDAKQDLSVQVHPNNEFLKKHHNSLGKTEMWYVMQAEESSKLVVGFKEIITPKQYEVLLKEKNIVSVLNNVYVKNGDTFFIEPGTIHSIGAGVVLAEIQQTSDITYRIYDFERVDNKGNTRELHTDLALKALNFSTITNAKIVYKKEMNSLNKVVKCDYFKTNFIPVIGKVELDYTKMDSFIIFMCVEGSAKISIFDNFETIQFGETLLIPAIAKKVLIIAENCKLLEVTV